ncbi:MAG TPA: TonB-dependent receptor [Usitatibacter sp.]|nr:TonB-dependent receptor [Usitatibacter sp.]
MKEIKRKQLSSALLQALGAGVAVTLAATAAHAQTAQRVEKIEVTGSNIKRVDQETVAPVEIITREQIERTGQPTVAEVLRNIPANSGGSFSESFTNSFAPGAAGISLRGLGQKTTLVLLNGRRTAGYGFAQNLQDAFVDLNSIPSGAVERIEILKDGASAVYGSDAIAGVVNIILRKDFRGVEATANVGYYEGGVQDMRATLSAGMGDLARDRWSAFGTFDFYKRDLLLLSDTDYGRTRDMRDQQGGRNHMSLTGTGTWRQLTAANANTNFFRAISECPTAMTPAQAIALGIMSPVNDPRTNSGNFNQHGNTFCVKDFNDQFTALPETERYGFLGRVTREFSANLTGYVEVGLSQVNTFQRFQAPFFAGTTGLQQTAAGLRPFVYNVRFAPGSAGNPFDTNATYNGVHADLGARDLDVTSDTMRFLGGLQYSWRTWDFDSAIGYSKNEIEQLNINRTTLAGTSAAFGVPATPQPPIPVSTNSLYNLDRPSQNSDALRNSVRITFPRQADSELKFVDTKASTEFGRLPGGPIGLALGAEYREETLEDRPDINAQTGNILAQGITATNGQRDSTAIYGEFSLPLTRIIELNLAARHDRYSDFGNTTNPKAGIKIKPTNSILLRANWGRGFRAPSLPEISPSVATFFTSVIDPVTDTTANISGVFAGNPSLNPEKSESATAGIIFEPNQNFSIGLNYYRIEWKDQVASPSFQSIVNSGDPTRVIRDPATGLITTVLSNYINLAETKTDGVDLEARYRMSTAMGRVTARANVSYIDTFEEAGVQVAGTNGGTNTIPRTRGNLALDWDYRALAATLQVNYVRGYYQQLLPGTWFTAPLDPNVQNGVYPEKIRSHTTYDLFARYNLTKNLSVSASVININDKKPPYDPGFSSTFLYDFSVYDIRGRRFNLGLSWKM